jgi:hypothetical protein
VSHITLGEWQRPVDVNASMNLILTRLNCRVAEGLKLSRLRRDRNEMRSQ